MGFTRAIGGNSPEFGVRVVGINPGPVLTGRVENLNRKKAARQWGEDRKSTRLNSSHQIISYAVFCLKKKTAQSTMPISLKPRLSNLTHTERRHPQDAH